MLITIADKEFKLDFLFCLLFADNLNRRALATLYQANSNACLARRSLQLIGNIIYLLAIICSQRLIELNDIAACQNFIAASGAFGLNFVFKLSNLFLKDSLQNGRFAGVACEKNY